MSIGEHGRPWRPAHEGHSCVTRIEVTQMEPRIDATRFGSITIGGKVIDHDVVIRLDGRIKKRKKKLSKDVYGSSHTVALPEAEHVYEEGAERLVVGAGQSGLLQLSEEALQYLTQRDCAAEILPTPQAIQAWNRSTGAVVGLFHVTC